MFTKKSISIWIFLSTFIIVAWVSGFTLVAKFDNASAQQAAPTQNKGVTRTLLTAVDLGPEISGMQGRKLELRMVTIEPGGAAGLHSHMDTPGVAYLLVGSITEHRGEAAKEYHAGESLKEVGSHWAENKGASPAVLIVTTISKQQ